MFVLVIRVLKLVKILKPFRFDVESLLVLVGKHLPLVGEHFRYGGTVEPTQENALMLFSYSLVHVN